MTPGAEAGSGPPRPAGTGPEIGPIIDLLGPPISQVAWSPDLVAQVLEILPVTLRPGGLRRLKPVHADSLRVGLARSDQPGSVVIRVLGWYGLAPIVVHSTSWRYEAGDVVLTYAVAVEPPTGLPEDSLVELPVRRSELARGEATAPPGTIEAGAVLEHALRHLSWLLRDDPAIARALGGWAEALEPYRPEPFRALV